MLRSLWAEPRAPQPPVRVWRDWVLVAVLTVAAIAEGLLRADVAWRPVAIAMAVGLAWIMLWRRTRPLAVVAVAFGALIVLNLAVILLGGTGSVGLYTMISIVVLPYSLLRWGSGREAGIGLVFILVALVLGLTADPTGVADAVFGSMFLLFPATLGASIRYWASSRLRALDQVVLRERAQLARELHDTVAHHVSAIAIRAQAGRVVAGSEPGAALDALRVIEREASRTLAELRLMVGDLREREGAALAPQPGLGELEGLARSVGDRPRVELHLTGDLGDVGPSVSAAIYRITQESITNARRHARHVTRVEVRVAGDRDWVRLTVSDDGAGTATPDGSPGYGVLGMRERARLLGGSFEAGTGPGRGWTVSAVLPRAGGRR